MNAPKAHQPHDHLSCISDAMARADALCRERGAKMTALRRRVLELVWASHSPIGAYAILDRLRAEDTRQAAPPTVYRTLDFLIEQGLIHKIESLNAYVGCDHPERRHVTQFLICTTCGAAMEIAEESILQSVKRSAGATGFSVERVNIEAQGQCPACARAARRTMASHP